MNNNDAKKIINKLNARLKKLKDVAPNSYDYAIERLKQVGPVLTNSGTISTSKKALNMKYIDRQISAMEAAVPTVTAEIKYIEKELAHIDKRRLQRYGTAIPKRDKTEVLSELNAKRHFDKRTLIKGSIFEESYEAWETHDVPFYMTEELIELENEINRRLGKGQKGIKSYAELYAIQQLMEEYFEQNLEAASRIADNDKEVF